MRGQFQNCVAKVPDTSESLTNTERPLNMSVPLPMPFAAVAHPAEGQIRRLKSKVNKLMSLKFRLAHVGQQFPKGYDNISNHKDIR